MAHTRTISCNKSNWTGERVSVEVTHEGGTDRFALYGYEFAVEWAGCTL